MRGAFLTLEIPSRLAEKSALVVDCKVAKKEGIVVQLFLAIPFVEKSTQIDRLRDFVGVNAFICD